MHANPALKQARMLDAKKVVHQLGVDEAVKYLEAYKLVCFNDPDVVPLLDRAATKFAVTQPNESEEIWMALGTERRNLWNRLPAFPNLAVTASQLLSMHTTACVSELN